MAESENILSALITIIGILIALFFPVEIDDKIRLIIIGIILIIFIGITMLRYESRITKLEEKLKIYKELESMALLPFVNNVHKSLKE